MRRECVAKRGNTVSDETKVRVPLRDLCSIAETVAGMMHDPRQREVEVPRH